MPLHSVELRGGFVKRSFNRSPVVTLETDAASAEAIPAAIRGAADSVVMGSLAGFRVREAPRDSDGVLTWLDGETVLCGSATAIRHDLRVARRSTFVPVHVPCLDQMDFLTVQRRWFCSGRQHSYWNFGFRIQSTGAASAQTQEALKANVQPWAELARSVLVESARHGAGVAAMVRLWENAEQLPKVIAALVSRNLAVLMLRHNEVVKAEQFLTAGMKQHAGYSELYYLAALLALRQQRIAQMLPLLEKARAREGGFLGTGGESSYRIDWLMGLLAVRVGNHRVAFGHFLEGVKSEPVFIPAVEELLQLRVPPRLVEAQQWEFCRAARREPKLLEPIFEYLLLHRQFGAAERIARTTLMEKEQQCRLEDRLRSACAPFRVDSSSRPAKPGILLSGSFFEHTSLARINREIAGNLLGSQTLDVGLEPSSPGILPPELLNDGTLLALALLRHPSRLDLTIRHQWPPDFSPPARGKLAVIVPWEYGAVPRVWVAQIERNVDELWVPSRFVRDVFIRGGVAEDRVRVMPNGVDVKIFAPDGAALRPQGARGFVFLFVGGALLRKGVDVLLDAYKAAFDPGEDVTLLLVISGATGAYQHNSLMQRVHDAANDPRSPHVQPLLDAVSDPTLASLYRGCDAFVLPYRGEGFGMPLLEAMACGKPVITTAEGPSQDFCSEKTAYLICAREEDVDDEPPPLGPMSGDFTWFEPNFADLVRTLRHVYENRDEAVEHGRAAAKHVRRELTWPQVAARYAERIRALTEIKGNSADE